MSSQNFSSFVTEKWKKSRTDIYSALDRLENELIHYRKLIGESVFNPEAVKEEVDVFFEQAAEDIFYLLRDMNYELKFDVQLIEDAELKDKVIDYLTDFTNQDILQDMLNAFFFECLKNGGTVKEKLEEVLGFLDEGMSQ